MDSRGPSEACVDGGPNTHAWKGNFDDEQGPAQIMLGHVQWSIYSKRLSRGHSMVQMQTGCT